MHLQLILWYIYDQSYVVKHLRQQGNKTCIQCVPKVLQQKKEVNYPVCWYVWGLPGYLYSFISLGYPVLPGDNFTPLIPLPPSYVAKYKGVTHYY